MFLTKEQLDNIEQMAYQLFTPKEIAIASDIEDYDELILQINSFGTDAYRAFYRGYLKQVSELREQTIKAARNGSNPAQMELMKVLNRIQMELRYG